MALDVGDFTARVGDGGALRLQRNEGRTSVTNFANTFGGKVAAFFRGLFKPGTVAQENRNVLNAFVTSVRSDPAYGDSFADLAATTLARDIRKGGPLTTRKLQQVMDRLQEAKHQNIRFTDVRAHTVSEIDGPQPGCFGRMFADIAADKGLSVLLRDYDTTQLSRDIRSEVKRLGESGVGIVTERQAQDVARAKIDEFLTGVVARRNYGEAQELVARFQQIAPSGSVSDPETRAMLTLAAQQRGLPTDLSKYDFGKLQDRINAQIMSACASGGNRVSEQDARSMTQKIVNDFVDAKAQLFAHVDEQLSGTDATAMKNILIANPTNLKDAQYVTSIVAMRAKVGAMLDTFAKANPGRVEVYRAVKAFREVMEREAGKAMGTEFGGPELKAFVMDGLQFALETTYTDRDALRNVVSGLGSEGAKQFKGVLEFAQYDPQMGKHDATLKSYWQMNLITARIGESLENRMSLDEDRMQEIMTPAQITETSQIPQDLREAMTGDGFHLPG
jgi:hypothetical protein